MLLFLLACFQETTPTAQTLSLLLETPKAFEAELQKISDPVEKDIVLLQLAVQQPKYARMLCKNIQTDNAKEKCKQIIGRPHLGAQ